MSIWPVSFLPLLEADVAIQIHAVAAMASFFLGAVVLWRRKGTRLHRLLGRLWVGLMLVVATSALFIHETPLIGPFGPIHILVIVTYVGIGQGLWFVLVRRNMVAHRIAMQSVYVGALLLAGAFAFLPGRRMHAMVFGSEAGWPPSLMVIGAALVAAALIWRQPALRRG
jgi:uncharacterized membrane protein